MFSNTMQQIQNRKQQQKLDKKDHPTHHNLAEPEIPPSFEKQSHAVSHSPLSFRSKQQQPGGTISPGSSVNIVEITDNIIEILDSSDERVVDQKEKSTLSTPRKARKQEEGSHASSTATSDPDEDLYLSHRKVLGKAIVQPKAIAKTKEQPIQVSSKRSERLKPSKGSPVPARPHFFGVVIPPKATRTELNTANANPETLRQNHDRPKAQTTRSNNSAPSKHQAFRSVITGVEGPALTVYNDIDNDRSPLQFNFINDHVCTPGTARVSEDFNHGCNCAAENGRNVGCEYLHCMCLDDAATTANGKKMFPYTAIGNRKGCLRKQYMNTRNHIHECNAKCNCGLNCKNRLVQHGRKVPLEIFKTESRGWGLRCLVDLNEGQFIDTYRGEVLTHDEANAREAATGSDKASYLYSLDKFAEERNYSEEQILVVDGQHMGGPTRFINHSCDPNCRQFTVSLNHADDRIYELAFFALEGIPAGTELTFNYTDNEEDVPVTDEEVRKRADEAGKDPTRCLCGAENCKRWLWL